VSARTDTSRNLTEGSLYKPLMLLSLPIVASQLMQVAYNLVNTYWVGHIGPDAIAAVSFAFPLVFLLISLGSGFAIAGTALVAQHRGADQQRQVDHVAGQTITFTALASAALGVVGWILSPWLVSLIGATPGSTIHLWAVQYTRVTFAGVFAMYGFFVFQALLRGWGDTRTPMYLMGFGVLLNAILDPFLIYGFTDNQLLQLLGLPGLQTTLFHLTGFAGFGVEGAAFATLVSRGVAAAVGLGLLFSGRVGIHLSRRNVIPDPTAIAKIVRVGLPASVDQSTRALGMTVVTALVATSGPTAVAAYGIGIRLNSLVFLPAIGLAQGTSTAVGQNLGAGKPERSRKAVLYAAGTLAVVLAFASVVAWFEAGPIVGIFVGAGADRANVIADGVQFLRIIGPTFLFLGVFRVTTSAFRGSGHTTTAMAFTILSLWVFRLPPAYALLAWFGLGASGVWYAIAFSNVLTAVLTFLWFRRGTWASAVIEDERGDPGGGPGPETATTAGAAGEGGTETPAGPTEPEAGETGPAETERSTAGEPETAGTGRTTAGETATGPDRD